MMFRARFHVLTLAALAIAVVSLSSCKSKGPAVPVSQQEALERSKAPVNLLDKGLKGKIASDFQEKTVLPDERLQIAVNLRNRTTDALNLEIRTVFKDEEGISTGEETAWKDIFLESRQSITWRAESVRTDAQSYTVEVRKP